MAKTDSQKKKTDEREIIQFIKDSPSGIMSTEIADEFGIAKSTARETLSKLADKGEIEKRTISQYNIYYTDDSPTTTPFGTVEFLSKPQRQYLLNGNPEQTPESILLDDIREQFNSTLTTIPFNDGFDEDDMVLVADRLGYSLDTVETKTPSQITDELLSEANSIRSPADKLFSLNRTPNSDELEEIVEWVPNPEADLLDALDEETHRSAETWQSILDTLTENPTAFDIRQDLARCIKDLCKEDVLGPRSDWAIQKMNG